MISILSYVQTEVYTINDGTTHIRAQLVADSENELPSPTGISGFTLEQGSTAIIVTTSQRFMLSGAGSWFLQTTASSYTKAEIDTMFETVWEVIEYYHTITIIDIPPIVFYAPKAGHISAWSISGNEEQTGTPTPDAPIMPTFCGTLNGTDWTIPLACAGQTVHVYLGQTQTVRRVRKLVLEGTENWSIYQTSTVHQFYTQGLLLGGLELSSAVSTIANYGMTALDRSGDFGCYTVTSGSEIAFQMYGAKDTFPDVTSWKAYLAAQYAAGTPVTVWYVLATEQTGIVNEPLAKIGKYADTVSSTNEGSPQIPIEKGSNLLTIDTTLQPSEVSITGLIVQP